VLYRSQQDIDQAVQGCLALADNDAAMACAIQVAPETPSESGLCAPRFVLLTEEGCSPCAEEKETLKEALSRGEIEEVAISSERGKAIMENTGVDFWPAVLLLDCTDHLIEPNTPAQESPSV